MGETFLRTEEIFYTWDMHFSQKSLLTEETFLAGDAYNYAREAITVVAQWYINLRYVCVKILFQLMRSWSPERSEF